MILSPWADSNFAIPGLLEEEETSYSAELQYLFPSHSATILISLLNIISFTLQILMYEGGKIFLVEVVEECKFLGEVTMHMDTTRV